MNLSVPAAKILRGSRKNQLPPEDRFQDKMSPGNRHEKSVRIEKTVQCNRYHPTSPDVKIIFTKVPFTQFEQKKF